MTNPPNTQALIKVSDLPDAEGLSEYDWLICEEREPKIGEVIVATVNSIVVRRYDQQDDKIILSPVGKNISPVLTVSASQVRTHYVVVAYYTSFVDEERRPIPTMVSSAA